MPSKAGGRSGSSSRCSSRSGQASRSSHMRRLDCTSTWWRCSPGAGISRPDTSPPLATLIAAAWFAVFPVADWSFHLLAMVNAAVAFFAIDLIARRYVSGDKRLLVLLLLLLTPFYQFHGQRFNANAILLSTWPIATYCFLRSFESRSLAWSAAAGVAAADAREILFGPAGRRVRRRGARAPPAARLSAIGVAVGIGRGGSCCAGAASALVLHDRRRNDDLRVSAAPQCADVRTALGAGLLCHRRHRLRQRPADRLCPYGATGPSRAARDAVAVRSGPAHAGGAAAGAVAAAAGGVAARGDQVHVAVDDAGMVPAADYPAVSAAGHGRPA